MKESDLIFGLMASFQKEEYSFADLMYLLVPFHISETNLRTSLSRMIRRNLLTSIRRGKYAHYRFDRKARRISSNVARGFKRFDWKDWDQNWWGILFSVPEINKTARYKIRKELQTYRFAPLYAGVWIRPYHEKEQLEHSLQDIFSNTHCKVVTFHFFKEISAEEVSRLWKLEELNNRFKKGVDILQCKMQKIHEFTPQQALVEKMHVGDTIVNILFQDPLLPDVFLPHDWKANELKQAFSNWDKAVTNISRVYWEKIYH